jgi:hypothetical protein
VAGPAWLAGALAVAMIATAVYCVSRLVSAHRWRRPTEYDVDGVHVLMGTAMAGMLAPRLSPFWAGGWDSSWDHGWEVVFGLAMGWFGWQAIRGHRRGAPHRTVHHLQHVLASGAMLYMFLAISSAGSAGPGSGMSMAGSPGSARFPTLALVLAVALLGYVIWTTDRLTSLVPIAVRAASAGAVRDRALAAVTAPATGQSPVRRSEPGDPGAAAGSPPPGLPAAGSPPAAGLSAAGLPMSPRLAACCEIVMGVTMGYMLITML